MNDLQHEIALLAATLARNSDDPVEALVDRAFAIWNAVHSRLAEPPPQPRPPPKLDEGDPGIPEPKGYPVKLEDALRLWMPKLEGRTAERMALFRRHLSESLRKTEWLNHDGKGELRDWPEPTKERVNELIKRKQDQGYNQERYYSAARSFLQWHAEDVANKRRAAARLGGNATAEVRRQERRNKPLAPRSS